MNFNWSRLFISGFLLTALFLGGNGDGAEAHSRRKTKKTSRRTYSTSYCSSKTSASQTEADTSEVAKRCSAATQDNEPRSMTCIQWVSQKAVEAMKRDAKCSNKLSVPLMMCIFKKEVSWYSYNPCGRNGCGLSQMTSAGVSTVKRGLTSFNLSEEYDYFWDLVGRPNQKANKCQLTRKSALDRDTSVIMAATHLCAEAKAKTNDSPYVLARDYNGSKTKNSYARFVTSCMKRSSWKADPIRTTRRSSVKGQCQKYHTCGGKKLSSHKSRYRRTSDKVISSFGTGGST